jgi:hypothetical protein
VQSRQERRGLATEQRERPVIEMEVQHIEFGGAAIDLLHHQHMRRHGVADRGIEAQGAGPCGLEFGAGVRITAGEQGDVVTHGHELFGQK